MFLSATENGWQDEVSFAAFMEHIITVIDSYRDKHPSCTPTTPMFIFIDSHFSRTKDMDTAKELADHCEEKSIEVLFLPPHLSHVLQPNGRVFTAHFTSLYSIAPHLELEKPLSAGRS